MPDTIPTEVAGFLAPGLTIQGHITGRGELETAAHIEGSIDVEGRVHVASGGQVTGQLHADQAEVSGVVRGDVTGADVRILTGGRVIGDVRAARISLEDGGVLEGSVEMDVNLPDSIRASNGDDS